MTVPAIVEVGKSLESMEERFAASLPPHLPAKKFVRTAINGIQRKPEILKCDRRSIYEACMRASQDGLILDGREAALVPYKGQAQYIPMVAGLLKKARQSGEISTISANVVYENDEFNYELGDFEQIIHRPALVNRGNPIAVYAICKLRDGGIHREVMSVEQIEAIRKRSRAASDGPWVTDWSEMARKTVLRRITKYLPASTDLASVIDDDDDDIKAAVTDVDPGTGEATRDKPATKPSRAKAAMQAAPRTIDVDPEPVQSDDGPEYDPETGEIIDGERDIPL